MRIVVLCGAPCSGKTTLARRAAQPDDVVLDFDDIAQSIGSPARWLHPDPYRTVAEQEMQAAITRAYASPSTSTAWVLRTAPRPVSRADMAQRWDADVYLLNPGERVCQRRARLDDRPPGTARSIGSWHHRFAPWVGDLDPDLLLGRARERCHLSLDLRTL